jgi:purine-binding chemotaxis protein CheW
MRAVHVKFRLGRERYALPIENVLEVAELGELTTIPGAGPGVLGVRNFNGQVLPVFDLGRVLGVSHNGRPPHVVVADHGGRLAGLAVDAVTDVGPFAASVEEAESEYLTHAVLEDGRLVGVVDVGCLFEALAKEAA